MSFEYTSKHFEKIFLFDTTHKPVQSLILSRLETVGKALIKSVHVFT